MLFYDAHYDLSVCSYSSCIEKDFELGQNCKNKFFEMRSKLDLIFPRIKFGTIEV